jgi:aspartyl protease family protein
VLYAGFSLYLKPRTATINAEGELVIPRHRDGHFYVDGEVNGKAIRFLVDTGATRVAVSESFAQIAGLPTGHPITIHTANGAIAGRLVPGVAVSAGNFGVSSTSVTVGLVGMQKDLGLLGQSFLSEFDVRMSGKQLVLRRRAQG